MAGLVTSILSAANMSFGGVSGSATAGEDYTATIGSQGLVGTDLISNSLVNSIDELVKTNTELFSAERELQIAINNLGDIFLGVARVFAVQLGGFGEASAATNFGQVFGKQEFAIKSGSGQSYSEINELINKTETSGLAEAGISDFLKEIGFSTQEITNSLVDSGIQFGATIQLVGSELSFNLENASAVLVTQVTTTTNDWWGLISKTSTRLETLYRALPQTLENALSFALANTLNTITSIFTVFGNAVDTNLTTLFSDIGIISIDTLRISLKDKSVQEQSDAIAAWFSNMGNTVISKVIPFITDFARAGEELSDTLIRITNTTIQLSNSFNKLGLDISFIVSTGNLSTTINSALEALKLEMVASWQEAFLRNFKDLDEFNVLFDKFSNALFTETELLEISLATATDTVGNGFDILRQELIARGDLDLLATLGPDNTSEALRAVYELGQETNAFATVVDVATGEIDSSGADLFATMIQLGAALDDQQQAIVELEDSIDNLNQQYERQIALFGLLGKELELLQLSFDFEDAVKEAMETGTEMSLVETYYGLLRLDIIRDYNQRIVDSIEDTMLSINGSILTVLQSALGWNEVSYQSIRVTKIVDKLATSLGNIGQGINFSVFSDLSDTSEFLTTLEKFIEITVGSGETITDQINLVEELQNAVMARYEAEVAAAEDLESSIMDSISALKDLSEEIGNFLDDLFVGDLSPLTNAQKLAEAQTQFDTNLQNVLSQDTELAEAARGDLLQSASTLLELANVFWAIGPEYQAIFNNVVGALESIDQNLLAEIGLSEETLAINSLEDSLTELQLQTITQLQTLDDILVALNEQNTINLNNELTALMPSVVNNLDAILVKLDQVNNDSWNPILTQLTMLNNTMGNFAMNSFASGAEEISYDQVAMIHKGETILTSDTSKSIRSGDSIYGTADALSTNSGDNSDIVSAISILTQVVASGNEDMLNKNEELRVATKDVGTSIGFSKTASTKGIV